MFFELDDKAHLPGVFECLGNGSVSSACIFANGPTADQYVCTPTKFLHRFNNSRSAFTACRTHGYDLGLHLNLTAGRSITSVSSITDEAGNFLGKLGLRDRIMQQAVLENDLAAEIQAQLRCESYFCPACNPCTV